MRRGHRKQKRVRRGEGGETNRILPLGLELNTLILGTVRMVHTVALITLEIFMRVTAQRG